MILDGVAKTLLPLYPRGSDNSPIGFSCNIPKKTLNIDANGNCYLCSCEAWLPITVGNILSFQSLENVWNCETATFLQDDVQSKKFTYCAVKHCGITNRDNITDEYKISVNIDNSCNLACPSCRTQQINHTKGEIYEEKNRYITHFLSLLEKFTEPLELTFSASGDPLASMSTRQLVLNWDIKENQKIVLFTNGLLIKKFLPESRVLTHIKQFRISIDAGTSEVYEQVRWPGKFSVLEENLQWLSEIVSSDTKVNLCFCLSKNNATDIINFANLCKKYGFRGDVTKIDDWGTFDDFDEQDVIGNINHPLRSQALKDLRFVYDMNWIYLNPLLIEILKNEGFFS